MIYIVDDFYPNPDVIRERALELDYIDGQTKTSFSKDVTYVVRRHTGERCLNPSWNNMIYLRNRYKSILDRKIISYRNNTSNGAFNLGYTKKHSYNWIHGDHTKDVGAPGATNFWAAVIYLTPNPPKNSGTVLMEHIKSGARRQYENDRLIKGPSFYGNIFDSKQITNEWKPHLIVENKYNRCVIYDAYNFHAPTNGAFGHDKKTGRLAQIGFWETE